MYHDRTAWRCAVFVGKSYGSKGYPQRNAAHVRWTLLVTSSSPLKEHLSGGTLSWQWRRGMSSVRVVPTATTIILRCRFPGTCETVGQVFKFVWRLQWKINAVCMSLSPLVSFKSRFVTYLLNFPRTWQLTTRITTSLWTFRVTVGSSAVTFIPFCRELGSTRFRLMYCN